MEQITSIRIAHAPPGHHSVIGRPSAGGLNHPEYVIYRGEQVHVYCTYTPRGGYAFTHNLDMNVAVPIELLSITSDVGPVCFSIKLLSNLLQP